METNRYPDNCRRCGTRLAAGAGHRAGPPWATYCPGCTPASQYAATGRSAAAVVLRSHGAGVVRVDLRGRLNGAFDAYRGAVEQSGAKTRKVDGAWETTLPVAAAPKLIALLQRASVAVEVEDALRAAIDAAAAGARAQVAEGEARLEAADLALASTGRSLRGYQREGVRWLCGRAAQGALLADDMGLGKSCQALIALPAQPRVLVVCPAVAKGVWRREITKWRAELRATVLEGRGCLTRWPEPGEALIVNYDVLSALTAACPQGVVVIADESQALRNGKSQRTEKFRALADAARAAGGRVWLVSATPLANRPPELWSVLRCAGLEKEAFGSWMRFKELFGAVDGRFGIEWGTNVDPRVPELLRRVMLRRDKRDVAKDLPAKSREVRTVTLDREGLKAIETEIRALLKEGQGIDELLEEIEQGGVAFDQMSRLRSALAGAKLPAVLAIAEEFEDAEEPLVVFSAHRAVVDALAARPGWGRISGDETAEQKSAVEDAFQAGELKGVAATIKAGGVAITLTRACHALFVDQAWTPADNAQAEDRIYRIGQTRPVLITILQADHPVDERVADLLLRKTALYERSVGAARLQIGEVDVDVPAGDTSALPSDAPLPAGPTARPVAPAAPRRRPRRLYWRGETTPEPDTGAARGPADAAEVWAQGALAQLCASDPDRAQELNGVGFNKADGGYGHQFHAQLSTEGLTDRGWKALLKLLAHYHRQIGRAPKAAAEVAQ